MEGKAMPRSKRLPPILIVLYIVLHAAGCGGGGSSRISDCDLDLFTPNYIRSLTNFPIWPDFPLRVFFVKDEGYSTHREEIARKGFDQWVEATGGLIFYTVVSSESSANMTVRFDPTTQDGLTEITYSGLRIDTAEMTLGVGDRDGQPQKDEDLQCIAAHEFAHGLGVNGHSDNEDDLLYPIHFIGAACPITTRDLNTVKTGYCTLFTSIGAKAVREETGGPTRTFIIR
jgi:hypothetical protein